MAFRIKSERVRGVEPRTFREGGRRHYNVRIFLDTDNPQDLEQVDSVQYELHPTFRNRHRVSSNRAAQFEILIWSYGFFTAKAKIVKKNGTPEDIDGFIRWETGS